VSAAELLPEMQRVAERGDVASFLRYARSVHPSDLSDVLAQLDDELQLRVVQALPPEIVSEALAEMEVEEHPEELLAALRPEQAAGIVSELEADDAADLIGDLPPDAARRILSHVAVADRADVERLLAYGEETAGGRMTTAMITVPTAVTLGEALESVRAQAEEIEDFFQVYCVEPDGRLGGVLSLQHLVVSSASRMVRDVMEPPAAVVTPDQDQEEVARLMARYNLPAMAVADGLGRLLGRITFDDVIDVVEAESTEDLLKFGGVPGEEGLVATWHESVRKRLPWLYVNLLTASVGALVVYLFQQTIADAVALAVWMPVVAGMGGNAGTQALAVTVRRIALGLVPAGRRFSVVGKELAVGAVNGLAVGALVGVLAGLLGGHGWTLGAVVWFAMWGNLVVAAVAGSFVPLLLEKLGVDPAIASSMFVTAFTDTVGFLLLLGLGSRVLGAGA
jgi:magnesium transporter